MPLICRARASRRLAVTVAYALLLAGCTDDDGSDLGDSTRATTSASARAEPADVGPAVIPELRVRQLEEVPGSWRAIRASATSLYAFREAGNGNLVIGRFDPASGELLTSREVADWNNYTVTDDGIIVMRAPLRRADVLDPTTLADLRSIPLPEGRPDLNSDLPRRGPFWIGIRQTTEGQLAAMPARMALARLDLAAGTVAEIRDVTACGAKSAAQIDDRRVAFVIECAYQPAVLDLETGKETAYDGFPDGAHTFAIGDTAWFRWKPLGYLARVRGDRLQTLDLNADGPVVVDLASTFHYDGSVWLTGEPALGGERSVLYRIDSDSFEVVARAWITGTDIAFVGDVGYVAGEGGISSFEPDDVTIGAPRKVVRPEPGLPPAVDTDDPEQRAVLDAFTTVFDPTVPAEQAASAVEDPAVGELRAGLVELTRTVYPGALPRATAVAVDGDTAAVNYVIERDGKLAFVPVSTTLRRVDGRWVVTRDGVCRLVELAALPGC